MKNRKNIMAIVSILVIIVISTFSIFIYKDNNEKKIINEIEAQILNGDYENAIVAINEAKSNERLTLYKNILEDFLDIKNESNIRKVKQKLDEFKDKYKDNLNDDKVFSKLNEDILKIEEDIKTYYDEINNEKEKISQEINNDIALAKELINEFIDNYPNEDIDDIKDEYKKRLEEIESEKIETEKKSDSMEIEDEEIGNNQVGRNKLAISNTVASKRSSQIITVVSKGGSYGELAFWEKDNSGNWTLVDKVSARLGQNGMKSASEVYEMDKCTPTGIYSLTEAFGINADPGTKIRYRQLDGSEYWVDDVNSELYNTMQFGEPNGRWNSAEKLIDFPGYYNYSLVVDYNRWPVIPGKSSAIFIHCDIGSYTYGCVAIPEQNLVNILKRLDPEKDPFVIMDFTYEDIYNKY